MRKVVLIRNIHEAVQELGQLYVYAENGKELFHCKTLERAWKDNKKNESCVPKGTYPLKFEWSNRFAMYLWELYDVPDRAECKIHASNYWHQLNGCIALGDMHLDINGDGWGDVRNSVKTVLRFHDAMSPFMESTIHIIEL